jgi:D-sedoheptulose 7-phosphate isomerase
MSVLDVKSYLEKMCESINNINPEAVAEILETIKRAVASKKHIFLMGNGGSAATANHFAADFGKNAVKNDEGRPKIISLCTNMSTVTAYGNDVGYEDIFIEQLKNLLEPGDVVIAISASGNSSNVIKAVRFAHEKKAVVIGLTGFQGGKLKEIADYNLNIESDSYEQIEDIHSMITHSFVYCYKQFQK